MQSRVFPKLRELCAHHGCRFQAIDLRWGVSEEAALDQQTMKICLEEIDRCRRTTPRPNFIVLLGDRYGWRPLPAEVSAVEFEQLTAQISEPKELALVEKWYKRDDNAVPPVYDLQPRTGKHTDSQTWEQLERRLRQILVRAVHKANLAPAERVKYCASATHQEIMRGAPRGFRTRKSMYSVFSGPFAICPTTQVPRILSISSILTIPAKMSMT